MVQTHLLKTDVCYTYITGDTLNQALSIVIIKIDSKLKWKLD